MDEAQEVKAQFLTNHEVNGRCKKVQVIIAQVIELHEISTNF
jgi:hypothetical protein